MDIPDIHYAVQFGAPDSLSVVTQRLGRAGRDRLFARAIILAQDTMFELKKPHINENSGEMLSESRSKLFFLYAAQLYSRSHKTPATPPTLLGSYKVSPRRHRSLKTSIWLQGIPLQTPECLCSAPPACAAVSWQTHTLLIYPPKAVVHTSLALLHMIVPCLPFKQRFVMISLLT